MKLVSSRIAEHPEVVSLQLEGTQLSRLDAAHQNRVRYMHELPRWIPCSNPECRGRGYYMGSIMTKLVEQRAAAYKGDWVCDGCWNVFRFTLELTYADNAEENCPSPAINN